MPMYPSDGSFSITQKKTHARQAQKAIFKLNYHLIKFFDVTTKDTLDLLDKFVCPILNYAA